MAVTPVTRYRARDGTEFTTESAAQEHEDLLTEADQAMAPLGLDPRSTDETCNFANGEGYVQHRPENVAQAKAALCKMAARYHEFFRKHSPEEIHPMGGAGRILDDAGPGLLSSAWSRLCRIDEKGREWGQEYYALHPEKGVLRALERRF